MELKCVVTKYNAVDVKLVEGQTTEGMGLTEARKKQMLADYPEKFEVVSGEVEEVQEEVEATTEETSVVDEATIEADAAVAAVIADNLEIENTEPEVESKEQPKKRSRKKSTKATE